MRITTFQRVKDVLVRLAVVGLPLYFKYVPLRIGKRFVWRQIVVRHLLWRRLALKTTSTFGRRFEVQLPDIVQSYLYFFGVWEPVITKYLLEQLREGDVFIDVGANIGYYTILASRCVGPGGKVFAIEAASPIYEKLLRNVSLNDAANVTTFHVAVSDTAGQVPVWLDQGGHLAGTTTLPQVAAGRRNVKLTETVEARPLHEVIDPAIVRSARFIKIDVEGAEWAVAKSLGELLKTVSPRTEFIVEASELLIRRAGGTVEEFLEFFSATGFEPYVIANRYDVNFFATKVRKVELKPLKGWPTRQLDLVFRKPTIASKSSI